MKELVGVFSRNTYRRVGLSEIMWWMEHMMLVLNP